MAELLRDLLAVLTRLDARAGDRRGRLRRAFWEGAVRGLGHLVGFAVAGTVLVYILQYLARANLPLISDFVADVVTRVQLRMQ